MAIGDSREGQAWRSKLGFTSAVLDNFDFLTEAGFRLTGKTDTLVRYENNRRIVRIYHGRSSYEVGVEIGRWTDVRGEKQEQFFQLSDVIALKADLAEVGFGGHAANDRELVQKFVRRLGPWTREFAMPLLRNGDDEFDKLREINIQRSDSYLQGIRASRLRAKADEAWRRHDFDTVINVYREIESELPTVGLKPSEQAKLRYALKATASDNA